MSIPQLLWWLVMGVKQRQVLDIKYRVTWQYFNEKGENFASMKAWDLLNMVPSEVPKWPARAVKARIEWQKVMRFKDKPDLWERPAGEDVKGWIEVERN